MISNRPFRFGTASLFSFNESHYLLSKRKTAFVVVKIHKAGNGISVKKTLFYSGSFCYNNA